MATGSGTVHNGTWWVGSSGRGLESYSIVPLNGISLEEYERAIYRAMSRMGNRQEGMMPVEYRIVGEPSPYGYNSVRIVGDVVIDGQKVGDWRTTIKRKCLDVVKENLCSGKEQPMSKKLFEVHIVNKGLFVDVWTGIASTSENARFKALKALEIDTDVEDLDIFTRQVGVVLRDDCCD